MSSQTTERQVLERAIGQTKKWAEASAKIKEEAQSGGLPSGFKFTGDSISDYYNRLDPQHRQFVDSFSPQSKTSVALVMQEISDKARTDQQAANALCDMVTQLSEKAATVPH